MSIAAASTGETLAEEFEKLYKEYCHFVYRTAYAITGNRQDAEDVLQSIFVKLLEREVHAELAGNPRAYLHRAAVNLSLNVLRSRRRRKATENVEELTTPPIAANGSEECADDDLHERLLDAITSLKPKAAEVLLLHYKHKYSDAEIARMLGKSRGTIAVTLYRLRARLRKLLRDLPRDGEKS